MADTNISHADALQYWESIPADVDGMLGGFARITGTDLQGSRTFLARLGIGGRGGRRLGRVVDCGAGIGRITEGLLLSIAETVDIVEPISKFSDVLHGKAGIGNIYTTGLENWFPETCVPYSSPSSSSSAAQPATQVSTSSSSEVKNNEQKDGHTTPKYDLIWNQWCLGHLTDAQLVSYLQRCAKALNDGGYIIVKENLSTAKEDVFDELDSSVTRKDTSFASLFALAGLQIHKTDLQRGLPAELYPVRIYALVLGPTTTST